VNGVAPSNNLIEQADILNAREVIAGRVHRTPVTSSSYLGEQAGVRLHFKLELFQKTGSFKPRGVLNKLHHMSAEEKQKGVITISAGNHAQALAWGATQLGVSSTVVMPAGSQRSKIEATQGYGGEVILTEGGLMETCLAVQKERDLTLVHPFDDPFIIAGQGTVGLEILEDVPGVDAVIVGVGGGGLISGIATAIKAAKPESKIIGVEPEGACAMHQSLQRGEPVHLERVATVADGLAAPFAGQHTLAHVQAHVDDVVIVSDEEIVEAMALIIERCKVVAEPAAASTLAALLSGKINLPSGSTVVCVLSGGNVDRERLKALL
jgi:threonine dehydratase